METVSLVPRDVTDVLDQLINVQLVNLVSFYLEPNVLSHVLLIILEMVPMDAQNVIQHAKPAQQPTFALHVWKPEVNQSMESATHVFIHVQLVPNSNHVLLV